MNFNQIQRALKKDRDAALKVQVADQFARDADRKFLAGRMEESAQLRETADWLRAAPPAQARKFLGTIYNAMTEHDEFYAGQRAPLPGGVEGANVA